MLFPFIPEWMSIPDVSAVGQLNLFLSAPAGLCEGPVFSQRASVTAETAVTGRVCPDTVPHPECDPHYGKRLSSNLHILICTHACTRSHAWASRPLEMTGYNWFLTMETFAFSHHPYRLEGFGGGDYSHLQLLQHSCKVRETSSSVARICPTQNRECLPTLF